MTKPLPVGIDCLSFYTPISCIQINDLIAERAMKTLNIGQHRMGIPTPDEDIITLATNAAKQLLDRIDVNQIDMLLFATESALDRSKASGMYVHKLLGLSPHCRVLEFKQACYAGTGAMQLALSHIRQNPNSQCLLITADIARYEMHTPAEFSQGAAAVAMLLKANPRTLTIRAESGFYATDQMDFWRPNYADHALVNSKLSCELYLKLLQYTWQDYCQKTAATYHDHQQFCFHVPVPKLAEKAHARLAKLNNHEPIGHLDAALAYCREVGNSYTAALFLSLLSLLENHSEDMADQKIGFYSYGSGAMAEFFSGTVVSGYQSMLRSKDNQQQLADRIQIDVPTYEAYYQYKHTTESGQFALTPYQQQGARLAHIHDHKRVYEHCEKT